MDEQNRYKNLSLGTPYSDTPPEYNTRDELLDAMDAYIEECEVQDDLCGLARYENALNAELDK